MNVIDEMIRVVDGQLSCPEWRSDGSSLPVW